jgi:hypothetical protein
MADIKLIETVTSHGCCRLVPLDQLLELLAGAALDAASDRKVEFTDVERERLRRQGGILSNAVDELVQILIDHPQEHIREHRLTALFAALGATTFIASHVINNKTLNRVRATPATNENVARKERIKEIIADELAKLSRSDLSDKAKASLIQKKVRARAGSDDLRVDTITKYMREMGL